MSLPSPVNPVLAEAAVEDFFASEKWRKVIERNGWIVSMVNPLTIIVSLEARPIDDAAETFTLRLACDFYPTHPPDARFVNPATLGYDVETDRHHLANLQAPYCHVHPKYEYQDDYKYAPQLVCSSMTLGYYFSRHSPTPEQAWDPQRDSIGRTIHTVYRALHSQHYHGRHHDDRAK